MIMAQVLNVEADPREDFGKNASRRLRHAGRIPAVVYGGGGPAIPVTIDPKKIMEVLQSEFGHNALFTLDIRGKAPARVMLREWQVDPIHGDLLHVDMVRVARDAKLRVKVPIHVTGEAKGVKVQGGIFEFVLREVEVECLPDDIPDHIAIDVTELTIGRNLRVADLPLGERVKVLTDANRVVAHVVALKAEEEKPAVEAVEAAPAEPEVIRKGKAEEVEAEGEVPEGKKEKEKKE
jgi:large subunit ribosomal protein L25